MQEIFRTLPALLKVFDDDSVREAAVFAAWRRMAVGAFGSHAVPVRLDAKTLVIAVSGAVWKRQLEDLAGQLLFRLNAIAGSPQIELILFEVDTATVRSSRPRDPRGEKDGEFEASALAQLPGSVVKAADKISDPQLRNTFLLAAGCNLNRMPEVGDD